MKTGDRSEKIRTYNYPQNRVSDHRIGLTIHQLTEVMDGKLASLVDALVTHATKLRGSNRSSPRSNPLWREPCLPPRFQTWSGLDAQHQ